MRTDYYRVLGVGVEATSEQIRQAYRALAREYHPDRNPDRRPSSPTSMALVNEAWATLGEPSRRRAYDRSREVPEPLAIQEAVLRAARAILLTGHSRRGQEAASGEDLFLEAGKTSVRVRCVPALGLTELGDWIRSIAFEPGRASGCAVVLACRVLVAGEVRLRIDTLRLPAVAVDLTEARAYGHAFPCVASAELFRPFLKQGGA